MSWPLPVSSIVLSSSILLSLSPSFSFSSSASLFVSSSSFLSFSASEWLFVLSLSVGSSLILKFSSLSLFSFSSSFFSSFSFSYNNLPDLLRDSLESIPNANFTRLLQIILSRNLNTFFFLLFIDAPSDAAIGRVGTGSLLLDNLSQNGFLGCPTLPVDFHLRSGDSFPFYNISI